MFIDLHMHEMRNSGDSYLTLEEIVEIAIDVATKVMNKDMDTKTNKALVEDFVEEVVN